ncbi:Uncharacterised protein [Mycolicibacterium vanbaalenii]|uniref:Uncharacterized protein n=1 Tax=Mycolicibacterium vanbaalenii TaxID=110539 RepID=A0A5S9R660_MYCVN|nr:Uncharacterised protein [Mycolicibacterium vanbaalenii]
MAFRFVSHRLDAACPDCGCPQWLHGEVGCLKKRRGSSRSVLSSCDCRRTAEDFAA